MEIDGAVTGEELNLGAETTPRPAATVILLRGGTRRLELLLVQRNPAARFMGGAWVFPGGAVDRDDGEGQGALRAAAVREVREEAGIELGDVDLVAFSRWITPAEVKIRFDTWFYLAAAPHRVTPRVDHSEIVDAAWHAPRAALDSHSRGEMLMVFPTIKHLEQLAAFTSAEEALAHARGREVEPVQPRVVLEGEIARVLLPGEPGYAG